MAYIRNFNGRVIDYSPLMNAASSSQAERMAQLASISRATKSIGAITSALSTVGDVASAVGSFSEGIGGNYTAEREKAIDKKRTNATINAGMSVVNLVLSMLATFGTSGAALPALIGSGVQMLTGGLLNNFNK